MLEIQEKELVFNFDKCQQCGICSAVCPKKAITFLSRKDGLYDILINKELCILCGKCVKSCPANKIYNYQNYFKAFPQKEYYLGYNKNYEIRRNSSSGGVCKTLIIEALKQDLVDGVYSLKKTDKYPFAEGEFYTKENIPTFDKIPNSIYHSVMACTEIHKIKSCRRILLVGTACQLRALNTVIKNKCQEIIRVCIFCKQQKSLDSTRFLAKIMNTRIPENLNFTFSYRGNGWPGMVKINEGKLPWHRAAQIPFGKRLWTVPGCNVCGDSYGIFAEADISLMDPWEIRSSNNLGETLITIHSNKGKEFLHTCHEIVLEPKLYNEVLPALSLKDVWRKQVTEAAFRETGCEPIYQKAAWWEMKQRTYLQKTVEFLPKLPIFFYRILAKLPDLRNKILK